MLAKVHMMAFVATPSVREVLIPDDCLPEPVLTDDEDAVVSRMLDAIFHFGQNDFAVGPEKNTTPSVSAGDVIEWDGRFFFIEAIGYGEISAEQLKQYGALPRHARVLAMFAPHVSPEDLVGVPVYVETQVAQGEGKEAVRADEPMDPGCGSAQG